MAPAERSESTRVELMAFSSGPPGSSSPLFIYFICIFFFPRRGAVGASDRQVHYMSQEFRVMLRLPWLLSSAAASPRYSSGVAKSAGVPVPGAAAAA